MVEPPFRWLVPEQYPVVCSLPVKRPVIDQHIPNENMLGVLPPPNTDAFDEFGPTIWGPEAYAVSFEKFHYKEPIDFFKEHPVECEFADRAWRMHFAYLQDTRVIHITATEKNLESTPAFPKHLDYTTEREYLEEMGWTPYEREFARIDKGATPDVLWFLFMKKEVLKQEKIDKGDVRQILCADPIYGRIGACLEQHQNNLMKQACEHSSGQCGWTPFAGGFQRLIKRLEKPGAYYIEFDWTRFDGTIPTALFLHIKKLRWSLMNEKHRKRYRHVYQWYCKNLVHRYVLLPSGEVTRQDRGNPSGQISTTMDNNMVNYWLQAFEFCYFHGPDWSKWAGYDTIVYGDDRLTRTMHLPTNYEERVVKMYGDIFGMWVKPEKVKVARNLVGLTFCGFEIGAGYQPIPAQPYKLMASLLKPASTLKDFNTLHGKLLSFQILMAHAPKDHPFREYLEHCLAATADYISGELPKRFTDEQLRLLWEGGPRDGWRDGQTEKG